MTTATVLRAIVFSLLFVLAMKGTQYVAQSRFELGISNAMIALMSFLVIAVAVLDGKLFSSLTKTTVYFLGMFIIFSAGALLDAARRRKD